jgi:hypothetical protein
MLLRIIARWTVRLLAVLVLLFIATYAGDLAVYKLRGSPIGHITVYRYVSVPLKGQRTEIDYQGTTDTPCAEALFGQNALAPCWQLRRNPNQGTNL